MKLSELTAALSKVTQFAGDVEVELKAIEGDVITVVDALELAIDPSTGSAGSKVTITHGAAPAPAPAEPVVADPIDPAPAA